MSTFRLLNLMKLRKLQEDGVRAELARARATETDRRRREQRVRSVLGDLTVDASSAEAVQSIAAARASSSSMLGELETLLAQDHQAVLDAAAAYAVAKTRTTQLEKLEEQHAARVRRADLRAEQNALDEHAGRASFGTTGGTDA
ncbi:flagellar export protein FliJ [Pseudolysinimonas sp.]|jgi:flagellar FliJ protein|uniref:flagellar export protein FliJ n=1 Tax=Pseudolysinimonas sp. TaxID=2680009 RepID=UPI00378411FB